MPDNLIIRNFNDAIFVFNPKNRKFLFAEGTISNVVPMFLKYPDKQIDESYLHSISSPYKVKAKEDIELVRKNICDFLHGSNDKENLSLENTLSDEIIETPTQRLLAYAIKRWQIINASIELNYNCNLQCQCCYVGSFNKNCLQRYELQTIAKQLKKAGAVFILFTGGEILLRKDIFEIMNDFSRLGFVLEAKSNGILLTRSAIDKFASLNLLNLQISIYDIEDRYSVFTERHYKFNHLAENIKLAVKQEIPVSLSVLVGKHNVNDLDKYHDVLQRTGVVEIFYSPYIHYSSTQRSRKGKTISPFKKRDG